MNNKDIKYNWNQMAKAYELFTDSEDSYSNLIEWPAIKELLPNLQGKRILDLGCGTGRFSFLFEQFNPAEITGIDLSEEMVEIGKHKAVAKGSDVKFIVGDISDLSEIKSETIDFVFSSTTIHYISDLYNLMKEIYRVLAPSGTSMLSVIHPVYSAQYPISHDDKSFPKDEEWEVKYLNKSTRAYIQPWIEYNSEIDNYLSYSYHHTMSDYINSILKSDFKFEALLEPMPPEKWKGESPNRFYGFLNTPTFAIFKISK